MPSTVDFTPEQLAELQRAIEVAALPYALIAFVAGVFVAWGLEWVRNWLVDKKLRVEIELAAAQEAMDVEQSVSTVMRLVDDYRHESGGWWEGDEWVPSGDGHASRERLELYVRSICEASK